MLLLKVRQRVVKFVIDSECHRRSHTFRVVIHFVRRNGYDLEQTDFPAGCTAIQRAWFPGSVSCIGGLAVPARVFRLYVADAGELINARGLVRN